MEATTKTFEGQVLAKMLTGVPRQDAVRAVAIEDRAAHADYLRRFNAAAASGQPRPELPTQLGDCVKFRGAVLPIAFDGQAAGGASGATGALVDAGLNPYAARDAVRALPALAG